MPSGRSGCNCFGIVFVTRRSERFVPKWLAGWRQFVVDSAPARYGEVMVIVCFTYACIPGLLPGANLMDEGDPVNLMQG